MRKIVSIVTLSLVILPFLPATAFAITHAGTYKVPLTPTFPGDLTDQGCGAENSTTDLCSGTQAAFDSSFIFDRGTLEIKNGGRVGLKFDAIQIRDGFLCSGKYTCDGSNHACTDDTGCTGEFNPPCILQAGEQFMVRIWAQGFWPSSYLLPDPCGDGSNTDCLRRNKVPGTADQCYKEFTFTISGNHGDVNILSATNNKFGCGTGLPGSATIRRIDVLINEGTAKIPDWRLFGRPSWDTSIDTTF